MAPIKFEDHIKEQLEKRKIQPSGNSWDRLNSRLEEAEATSAGKSKGRWWISAAAAVAVLLIAGLLFTNQNNENSNPIVENPVVEVPQNPGKNQEFQKPVKLASEEETIKKATPENNFINDKSVKSEKEVSAPESKISDTKKEQLAQNTNKIILEPVSIAPPEPPKVKDKALAVKIDELIAKIAQKEQGNGEVSDAEVDALLAQAARELSSDGVKYDKGSIDANALLADVENEIDQSFRREVFEVLKEGFLKARTAIATRND